MTSFLMLVAMMHSLFFHIGNAGFFQVGGNGDMMSFFKLATMVAWHPPLSCQHLLHIRGKPSKCREINDKCNLWWTLAGMMSKCRKLMKTANGGPVRASHPNAEKLMINVTFGGPLQARRLKVEKLTNTTSGGPLRARSRSWKWTYEINYSG